VAPIGVGRDQAGPGQRRSGLGGAGRGRAWPSRTGAAPTGAGRGNPGVGVAEAAARGGLAVAAVRVEAMREREAGERKGRPGYYTCLCSSGQHISRRT
jgi:hypothetical protein